jgi:hypothetical protein
MDHLQHMPWPGGVPELAHLLPVATSPPRETGHAGARSAGEIALQSRWVSGSSAPAVEFRALLDG